ncbi:MAG: two pore domain potassium channel family protein [Chloroflexi bacterium]|nr:MAG: two pore domain potassium channel family protein [Chloroflexota bacterium]TME41565.1 MAG: two pore domain potassium channel family protein [Chloroflexota bacterium]TME51839.1 MAG: two pore domain potassium channel family protein [Chloroflexota bacterium]
MERPLAAVEAITGAVLLIVTFYDLFQSVVLPRPAVRKVQLARTIIRPTWRLWKWGLNRGARIDRSEARLAAFAPISLLTLFLVWGISLIVGYSLLIDSLAGQFRPPLNDWLTSFYVSATTLVPLSYGDFVPEYGPARLVIVLESGTGVALAALAITLLFELYGSFRSREESVVALDALAGAPPSAVQLLETAAEPGMDGALKETFDEWRRWSSMVLESHLAYPLLVYFRSSHDNEAWINSFGAVMDSAALVISSTDSPARGAAKLMFTVGNHLVEDLAWVFRFKLASDPIIEKSEYKAAIVRLKAAGYRVTDGDGAWEQFSHYRSKYASALNLMAQYLLAPPAQWVGDRSYLPHRQRPRRRRQPATKAAS